MDPRSEAYGTRGGARTTQRRGRMSAAKRADLAAHDGRWLLEPHVAIDLDRCHEAFGRSAPLAVEIGGGSGVATRQWAAAHPDLDVLALELHRPGIVALLRALDAAGPPNVRVVEADATTLLSAWPDASLHAIRVHFPDPWPKRRHVGRRLVDTTFVHRAADLLVSGGRLELATDWPAYADQMRSCLATEPRFVPLPDAGAAGATGWTSARPPRPVTAYEQRGIDAGRPITDLVVQRS